MEKQAKIYIAGHQGMVGSAILRNLKSKGYQNFILKSLDQLDLSRQADVEEFFKTERPDYVILAAAKVGGIVANNTYRAQFIYENLMIQNNVIHSAYEYGVKKLLFLGSSCIYPKNALQPLKENYLLTGLLEETNEPYAIAKITGIKMCENYFRQYNSNFISVMPTNLYGLNDNYDLEKSHVLPALIRKFHLGKCLETNNWNDVRKDLNKLPIEGLDGNASESKIREILDKYGIRYTSKPHPSSSILPVELTLWGTGNVYREFLHVDDMADSCVYIMENISAPKLYHELGETHINIGTGIDLTINELAQLVKGIVNYKGSINWDTEKPNGTYKKQLDVNLLRSLNWSAKVDLKGGIEKVYENYLN